MNTSANRIPRKKVAIVGSGCAGLAALWALNRSPHDVYIYEAADRLGGHTNTVPWTHGKYKTVVDTGFIVMNKATYPNFINFLGNVGVPTVDTEMTFGVSRDYGLFEWAGSGLSALFCQRGNLFSLKMWRMIFDILRFNQYALDLLRTGDAEPSVTSGGNEVSGSSVVPPEETIGEYLDREGYSSAFRDDYLIPMTAAVWSTSPDKCSLDFPAVTLIRFLWNHHLLSTVAARPAWMTIPTGSKSYVDAIVKGFPSNHIFLNTSVKSLISEKDGRVRLYLQNGRVEIFDHVILATHGDQAYSIIRGSATEEEKEIMSSFHTSENTAVLHSDLSLMPQSRKAWSSWNYMTKSSPLTGKGNIDQVCLTYNMNILQYIPQQTFGDVLVTLNPLHEPDPKTVQGTYSYEHPLYNPAAVRAQQRLPNIQNKRGISYAGAWTKYGFHEDGFSSGLYVAQKHLGAKLPFEFKDSTFSRGKKPELVFWDYALRLWITIVQVFVIGVLDRIAGHSRACLSLAWITTPGRSRKVHHFTQQHRKTQTPPKMNTIPFLLTRRIQAQSNSACLLCRRIAQKQPQQWTTPRRPFSQTTSRQAQQHQQQQQRAQAVTMERMRALATRWHGQVRWGFLGYGIHLNFVSAGRFYAISLILGTVAFSYGSVPMYKMICQTTGWGGQPVRTHGGGFGSDDEKDLASRLQPVTDAKRIRVTFSSSVSDVLPWKFTPQQREVRVLPGETALAFYTATNQSDHDIVGVATYSVTPAQVAPYFSKIQCFCFEEQRLNAGETVDMPVFFYLDPDLLNDLNMKGIETVTLSYTFFKAKYDDKGNFKDIPKPM
ncbi:amine oxidase [Apodospora peruviana]|uniref:Amine oxidase n=1 Tax=Apodospora peruviana TaxID=516989 RepID=A0AAE0HYQ6_9PEZI|nr:amine oxidase [Apodospora peruviana]